MKIGAETSNLLMAAGGTEPPATLGEQIEYLFAQQLTHALQQQMGDEGDGASYLGLLDDHLAKQLCQGGGLGIARQLGMEETP